MKLLLFYLFLFSNLFIYGQSEEIDRIKYEKKLDESIFYEYCIIIDVTVDGMKLNLLVDTGTTHTIFSTKVLSKVFGVIDKIEKPLEVNFYKFKARKTLKIGKIVEQLDGAHCMSLEKLSSVIGFDVHGILGMDILQKYILYLNISKKRFLLFDNIDLVKAFVEDKSCNELKLKFSDLNLPYIVNEDGKSVNLLDTGASMCSFPKIMVDAFSEYNQIDVLFESYFLVAEKEKLIKKKKMIYLNRKDDGEDEISWLYVEGDLALGMSFFLQHDTVFDFINKKLYIKKNMLEIDFLSHRINFSLEKIDGKIFVNYLKDKTSDFLVNDQLIEINGKSINDFELWEIHKEVVMSKGKPMIIKVSRNNKIITLKYIFSPLGSDTIKK